MIASDEVRLVWERYSGRLLAFLRGKVSDPHEAEDLLQEVFVRIHTGLCCLQEWPAMERWIYRVARNLVIDRYRARGRTVALAEEPESPYEAPDLVEDPAERLALSLREMVEELPEPHREALLLTEYEGLSQAEYASRSGLTLPAAKARVLRARERLREAILACCHVELDRLGTVVHYEPRCARCDLERRAKGG